MPKWVYIKNKTYKKDKKADVITASAFFVYKF